MIITKGELKIVQDKVKSLKEEINTDFPWFGFNEVCSVVLYDKIIVSGDSLEVSVAINARNSYNGTDNEFKECKIVLFDDVDDEGNYINPYDTITTKDWLGKIKIKTEGLGRDTIFGVYYMNMVYDPNRYINLPFIIKYLKIDSKSTESYLDVKSKLKDGNIK